MQKLLVLLTAAMALVATGCLKDTLKTTYSYTVATPVLKAAAEVRATVGNKPGQKLEVPGKIYVQGSYLFVAEHQKGLHIINNANPANPVNESFVEVPGMEDLAVKGNLLYVDCFDDLLVLDIANPKAVKLVSFTEGVFPDRRNLFGYSVDSNMVVVGWNYRDTTIEYKRELGNGMVFESDLLWASSSSQFLFSVRNNVSAASAASPVAGKGGSMARFALAHNHLYTVSQSDLRAFSLQQPEQPLLRSITPLGLGIETIYPFKNNLFIGSNTGMFIYTLTNPEAPKKAGTFEHARVCDPVIADDDYAYVTLRSGTNCFGQINQLNVLDILDLYSPRLITVLPLTNPHGLDKAGDYLYVCDGSDGLRVIDARNPAVLHLRGRYPVRNAYDVICWNKVAIVSAADGIHQFDLQGAPVLKKLSHIPAQQFN
ncbi:MAG: hypothetical protein MUF24_03310 [Chitinophagaceae bacterium]|jgi:hypothetical protein|nr:hypothetical protein [Chitinophagaceae bacterium]